MILKVLKSPSSVGPVIRKKAYMFYPSCRAVVRYTPTARCVLQICCTVQVLSLDKHTYNGATQIAPAYHAMPQTTILQGISSIQAVAPDGVTRCTAKIR